MKKSNISDAMLVFGLTKPASDVGGPGHTENKRATGIKQSWTRAKNA